MYFIKTLIVLNENFKNFFISNSYFKKNLSPYLQKNFYSEFNKSFLEKKIFLFNKHYFAFSNHQNYLDSKKPNFNCIFEMQFKLVFNKKKNSYFLGKIFPKKNILNVFIIQNYLNKTSNFLKKTIKSIFPENISKKKICSSKFGNCKKKTLPNYKKKPKELFFFLNLTKVSTGLNDHYFNIYFMNKKRKKIFFFKKKSKKNFLKFSLNWSQILIFFKKLAKLFKRSLRKNINFFFHDFIKGKRFLKKGFFLKFFSIGFMFKNFFLLSSAVFTRNHENNFNVSSSFLDFFYQNFFENKKRTKKFLPFSGKLNQMFRLNQKKNLRYDKNTQKICLNFFKNRENYENIFFLNNLMRQNEIIWNKKKSFSEFRADIFFHKLKKRIVTIKNMDLFFNNLLVFVHGLFSTLFFTKRTCKLINFKNLFKYIIRKNKKIKMASLETLNWNNLELDFKVRKFNKLNF